MRDDSMHNELSGTRTACFDYIDAVSRAIDSDAARGLSTVLDRARARVATSDLANLHRTIRYIAAAVYAAAAKDQLNDEAFSACQSAAIACIDALKACRPTPFQ